MINYQAMADVLPIIEALQQRPRPGNTSPAGHAGYDIAAAIQGGLAGYGQLQQQQALAELLQGGGAQFGPSLPGGDLQGLQPRPGLAQQVGIDPQQADALMLMDPSGKTLMQAVMQRQAPRAPIQVGQGSTLVDPNTMEEVYRAPSEAEGPLSAAGKIAADLGVDITTPDGQQAVSALAKAMQASTTINVGGPDKVPAGAVLPQAAAPGALKNIDRVAQAIIGEDGEIDRLLVAQMSLPGLGMAVPNTRGAELRSVIDESIQTLIYLQTGKAATEREIDNTRSIYMPSVTDTPQAVQDKLSRLDRAIRGQLEVSGRGLSGATPTPDTGAIPEASSAPGIMDQVIEGTMEYLMPGDSAPQTAAPDEPLDLSAEIEAGQRRIDELRRRLGR